MRNKELTFYISVPDKDKDAHKSHISSIIETLEGHGYCYRFGGSLEAIMASNCVILLNEYSKFENCLKDLEWARNFKIPTYYYQDLKEFGKYIKEFKGEPAREEKKKKEESKEEIQDITELIEGTKYDGDKLRWDLLDLQQIEKLVHVLTMGARKYADNNFQKVDNYNNRYFAALLRHLKAWRCGEGVDSESGRSHLDHAMCNIYFLMWGEDNEKE